MGIISTKKSLAQLEQLSTASFCRRRLSVVMVRCWQRWQCTAGSARSCWQR